MSDEARRDRVVDAFDAAVSYWHNHLDEPIDEHADTERPETAHDYFASGRGYDDETINEWRLGWAPGDGGLYDHLREQGFDADTIAATGLFCEKAPKKELWRGRYILPYFSADGRAEYAIARCTGSKGGGSAGYDGHSADFLAGKYAKVAHTRENVPLSEPILGLHTLPEINEEEEEEDDEPPTDVIVAEGIADAISATEAGYAVLSPVTKEFKREHFDAVVDAVAQRNVGTVYVVPDAEQASFSEIDSDDVPDEPEHAFEAITQPAVAPGPGGGLRTANYLVEHGIDARVVELPRPSGGKVDLDDYIQNWSTSLGPVLASAKRPQDHPKFDAATATQKTDEDVTRTSGSSSGSAESGVTQNVTSVTTEGAGSGLFELGVDDVNPSLEDGYRGKNPLGHTGTSENYFAVNDIGGTCFGKDYKRPGKPAYNGVTYLLVDLDERPVEGPEGPLSPREAWVAWAEARKRGLLGPDDPVPTKALEHVAREQELYDFDALDADLRADDVELPAKAHNRALYWVNEVWADGVDVSLDDDENATSKHGRAKTGPTPRTWEDVRYIYDESKEEGRRAARAVLSSRYDLMTVAETDTLQVYDGDTGTFSPETSALRGDIYDGLGSVWSTHELNEIVAGLRQQNIVREHELNGAGLDGPHICVENGVLDLLDRELKHHSPDYHFTDRVPVEYDPDADTTPYKEFVDGLVERDADAKALFEMVGHALTPDANERWKKFLILTGDADNGKSAFYGRVKALLDGPDSDERNTSAVKLAKMAQNRFSVYSLYGSMANIAGEIDGKKIRNTAAIKDITGGDPVELEPKGGDSFFDTVNTTLMFAANDPPIMGDRDKEAIATRIVPVELPYTFVDEPDGPYEKEAIDEAELEAWLDAPEARSGLLNLALDGVERLAENGGDVSLPESADERLRMYERAADPMREFGERCLDNAAADYVVKADVTTVYKEFATAEGYELGSNVGSVLHDVLRGVPGLNYTESRKRSPDYADAELPLRPWDERKRVVDRVTLTEEGLEYADRAGIVVRDTDEAGEGDSNPTLQAGEVDLSDSVTDKSELPPVRGTVAAVWRGRYTLEAELMTDDGSIDMEIRGFDEPGEVPLSPGVEYEIHGLRARNPNGEVPYVEFRPTSSPKTLERPDEDDSEEATPDATAATDGSGDGYEQLKKRVLDAVHDGYGTGGRVTVAAVAGELGAAPDSVHDALETIADEKTLLERTDDAYRRL